MSESENQIARPTIAPYNYVIAGILLVMGLIFGYLMSRSNASKGKLSMKIGSASVDMNVENDLQSMKALMDKVFKDENSRREMTALLGEFHKLYPVTDPKIVEEISKLSPENPVSKGLQNLCERQKGAFARQLNEIRLSFPLNAQFRDDEAVVCSGSDFFGRRIVIYDMNEEKSVTLSATRSRPCQLSSPEGSKESIQITKGAAKELFGADRLNSLNMFERGLAGIATN